MPVCGSPSIEMSGIVRWPAGHPGRHGGALVDGLRPQRAGAAASAVQEVPRERRDPGPTGGRQVARAGRPAGLELVAVGPAHAQARAADRGDERMGGWKSTTAAPLSVTPLSSPSSPEEKNTPM